MTVAAIKNSNAEALAGNCKSEAGGTLHNPTNPAPVSLYLPVPPSVNQAYKNTKRGRSKTKEYDHWLQYAYTSVRLQNVDKVKGRCVVVIGVERKSLAADIDNRIKLAIDALVTANVIDDDRFVTAIAITWLPEANQLCHIQIFPIQPLGLQFHPSSDGATGAWVNTAPSHEQEY